MTDGQTDGHVVVESYFLFILTCFSCQILLLKIISREQAQKEAEIMATPMVEKARRFWKWKLIGEMSWRENLALMWKVLSTCGKFSVSVHASRVILCRIWL